MECPVQKPVSTVLGCVGGPDTYTVFGSILFENSNIPTVFRLSISTTSSPFLVNQVILDTSLILNILDVVDN